MLYLTNVDEVFSLVFFYCYKSFFNLIKHSILVIYKLRTTIHAHACAQRHYMFFKFYY